MIFEKRGMYDFRESNYPIYKRPNIKCQRKTLVELIDLGFIPMRFEYPPHGGQVIVPVITGDLNDR